jgi:hypothetical protein
MPPLSSVCSSRLPVLLLIVPYTNYRTIHELSYHTRITVPYTNYRTIHELPYHTRITVPYTNYRTIHELPYHTRITPLTTRQSSSKDYIYGLTTLSQTSHSFSALPSPPSPVGLIACCSAALYFPMRPQGMMNAPFCSGVISGEKAISLVKTVKGGERRGSTYQRIVQYTHQISHDV